MSTGACPHCGATFEMADEQLGGRGQCYACGQKFVLSESLRVPSPVVTSSPMTPPPARAPVPTAVWAAIAIALIAATAAWILLGTGSETKVPLPVEERSAAPAPAPAPTPAAGPLGDTLSARIRQGEIDRLQAELRAALQPPFEEGDEAIERALVKEDFRHGLVQAEILRACGPEAVQAVAQRPSGTAFLEAFLRAPDWMESFLVSDPPAESYAQALENLRLLFQYGKDLDQPLYRRLATAFALSAGKLLPYRLVDRFAHTQRAHLDLLLHAGFDTMDVREMRWSIYLGGNAADYQYLLDDRQHPIGGYFGSCWACWYRGHNDFGDSIQGPWYHQPWRWMWPGWETPRRVGGVCGTLSTFGSHSARAHGVPSTPVGQPGHCAYIIRSGEGWPVAYSVTWPTGASTPGWEGTGYSTMHRLYEPVQHDRKAFRAAQHALWAARFRLALAQGEARIRPGLRYARYTQGVGAALPDFSTLTPERTGTVDTLDLAEVTPSPAVNFGVVWEGTFDVLRPGALRMSIQSDDGSRLLVDAEPVASANCTRGEKIITPAAGPHALRVEYSQGGGAYSLQVELKGVAAYGAWTASYERALRAQPLNYASWLEYIKALEAAVDVPTNVWLELAERATSTFSAYPEAAWALTHRTFEKGLASLEPARRMVFLVDCHRKLRQENAHNFEAFPFDGILNWQVDRLGDPQLALPFFGKLLALHTADSPHDWIFGQVLNWGQNRFAKDPQQAPRFAETMAEYFRAQGADLKPNLLRDQVTAGIRNATTAGDVPSFKLWSDMAVALLPAVQPGDVHLNAQQAAAFPTFEPLPGELLSAGGLLKQSSACQYDRPLSFRQLLAGEKFGGYFDTNGEDAPWAIVQLPGDAELSGIVLVNRYEYEPESAWVAPLRVSVSTDGKTWTPVANFDQVQSLYRIALSGKAVRARFVKAERLPGKTDRFHLRGFMVYGKKLY